MGKKNRTNDIHAGERLVKRIIKNRSSSGKTFLPNQIFFSKKTLQDHRPARVLVKASPRFIIVSMCIGISKTNYDFLLFHILFPLLNLFQKRNRK